MAKVKEVLDKYCGKLITYDLEQQLKRELAVDNRKQIIDYFSQNGYWLQWQDKYTAKGGKLFIPTKKWGKK